jgi:hypothetical protein
MNEQITNLEGLREKIVKHMLTILSVSIILALTVVYLVAIRSHIIQLGFFLLAFVGAGTFIVLGYATGYFKKVKEFKSGYKKIFVEGPFQEAFGKVYCDFNNGISKHIIEGTDLMRMGNRYYTNDYIKGTYKNVGFERADIKIQHHTSNGKQSRTVTYFNGRWLILEFNKNFHFDLQIIGKGFYYTQKNNSFFTSEKNRRHKIEMEDIHFNEDFSVYAQDEHEAFYILTPQFMATLKDMYNSMDGDLMLGFVDNKLHVAIHTRKDAMEPSLFRSVKDPNLGEVQREINTIIHIIDELNLDRDLYKGG